MNAKMLVKVIEVENRVNTICKCLVLGEADHFQVEYSNREVSITAYSHDESTNNKLMDLMRIYAKPEDGMRINKYEREERNFWTSEIVISLE